MIIVNVGSSIFQLTGNLESIFSPWILSPHFKACWGCCTTGLECKLWMCPDKSSKTKRKKWMTFTGPNSQQYLTHVETNHYHESVVTVQIGACFTKLPWLQYPCAYTAALRQPFIWSLLCFQSVHSNCAFDALIFTRHWLWLLQRVRVLL